VDKYIVKGLQPADTDALVLKRSVAPSFDIKGFSAFAIVFTNSKISNIILA